MVYEDGASQVKLNSTQKNILKEGLEKKKGGQMGKQMFLVLIMPELVSLMDPPEASQ